MKNKLATILIITITVILAGIAIFTAVRLYQLRNQSVSPNAPSSIPHAQEVGSLCGGITGASCPTGQECIYSNNTNHAPFPDASGTCQTNSTSDNRGSTTGNCSLSFTLTPNQTATPTATPTITPTPTAVPECNNSCTASSECPTGLTCDIVSGATAGHCRNVQCTSETGCVCATTTPTATPTSPPGTPNSCNGTCGSNSNCNSNLICSNGFCRNPSCTSSDNCTCPNGSTPNPTAPTLPQSGTDWPTTFGAALGVFVIIGSMLLAL